MTGRVPEPAPPRSPRGAEESRDRDRERGAGAGPSSARAGPPAGRAAGRAAGLPGAVPLCELHHYRYHDFHGVPYPAFMDCARIEELRRSFALEAGDVAICTFPKCGTTWMQQVVLLLLAGGDLAKAERPTRQAPWIERFVSVKGRPRLNLLAKPRVFKSHTQPQLAPWHCNNGKVIVVARNPLDAAVSAFHHAKSLPESLRMSDAVTFADFAGAWREGKATFGGGSWWDWHARWYRATYQRRTDQVLWVWYEDMVKDLAKEVRGVAEFLGVDASDVVVDATVAASSFDSMKQRMDAQERYNESKDRMVRKHQLRVRKVGGWAEYFDPQMAQAFREQSKRELAPALNKAVQNRERG